MVAPIIHGIAPPLPSLQQIHLVEAVKKVNMIHTGKVLFVKTIEKAFRSVGTSLLVQDCNNGVIFLNLYNFVLDEENPQDFFPRGSYLAVLEPYLRFTLDNSNNPVHVRCDNPQAVVVFDSEMEWTNAKMGIFNSKLDERVG